MNNLSKTVFFTLTDAFTQHTNSRSERYPTFIEAERAAAERLSSGGWRQGVYILQAVALVEPKPPVVMHVTTALN